MKCIKLKSVDELLKHFIEIHDIRPSNKPAGCQTFSNPAKNRLFFNGLSPVNHRIIIPKQEYISKAVAISNPITVTTRSQPPPSSEVNPIGGRPSPQTSPMDLVYDSTAIAIPEPTKKSFSCLECGLIYSKRQASTDMLQIHDKFCDQWRSIWVQDGIIKVCTLSL